MKEISTKQQAAIKRIAMNVDAAINRKNRLEAQKAKIDQELAEVYEEIELMEAPVRKMTDGYGIEDLITKSVIPTGKLDKNGRMQKTTKYEFKYPETIIPPYPIEDPEEGEVIDETPVEETETEPANADFNPIEGIED